jgi:hypothetical protein
MSLQITFNKKTDSSTPMQITAATSEVPTATNRLVIYPTIAARASPGGSLSFPGTAAGYLSITNSTDFQFGTGDFTVEMFLYQTGSNPYPRVFSMGYYSNATFALSIEAGSFILWIGPTQSGAKFIGSVNLFNAWNHVAITRAASNVRVFINGTQLGTTLPSSYDFADALNPLTIGIDPNPILNANTSLSGYLTNFNWVKGTALYTANFTKPTAPLTPNANSKLLLLATTAGTLVADSSGTGKTVTNNGNNVTFSALTPFS